MVTDRHKLKFVTICHILGILLLVPRQCLSLSIEHNRPDETNSLGDIPVRGFNSPRLDYNNNEWRPVGRGDPLKNDPTYDYSPPALNRVRYWAESENDNSSKEATNNGKTSLKDLHLKKANSQNSPKNEILLLGQVSERLRGQPSIIPTQVKNTKGEVPLLQPKYTSIRRSYYAHHQLPTHLMPPPMQNNMPMSQSVGQQANQSNHPLQHKLPQANQPLNQQVAQQHHQQHSQPHSQPHSQQHTQQYLQSHTQQHSSQQAQHFNQQHMQQSHPPQALTHTQMHSYAQSPHTPNMVKAVNVDYRHSMPSTAYSSASPMTMASHPQSSYSTTATAAWMHPSTSYSTTSIHHPHSQTKITSSYDSHHQPSMNHFSYSRPNGHFEVSHPPNSIHSYVSGSKQSIPPRKPWIHDLLQKELIKPSAKPTMSSTKYLMGPSKSYYDPLVSNGISTTYPPVAFVASSTTTTTSTTTQKPIRPMIMSYPTTTNRPIYVTLEPPTTATTTTIKPMPDYSPKIYTSSTSSLTKNANIINENRLLIPNTSNLPQRPTVAPMEMTTDSLFSHYNQPKKPLVGPMYLIIEGHSKVKTYGQNELDPHQPKIVPIIPKREPIVRRGDPNERRGTPETFNVKHLHTKTTQTLESSTSTTTKAPTTASTTTTITTPLKKVMTTNNGAMKKPASTKAPNKMTTITTDKTKMLQKANLEVKPETTTTTMAPMKTTLPTTKMSLMTTTARTTTTKKSMIPTKKEQIPKPSTQPTKPTFMKFTMKPSTKPSIEPTIQTPPTSTVATPLIPVSGPPTGMQGLLSLLDASLSKIFKEDPLEPEMGYQSLSRTPNGLQTTKLKPVDTKLEQQAEARISQKNSKIISLLSEEDNREEMIASDPGLRDNRQVYDYDELTDFKLKSKLPVSFEETFDENENENGDSNNQSTDDDDDDEEDNVEDIEDGNEEDDDDNGNDEDSLEILGSKLSSINSNDYVDKSTTILKRIDKYVDDSSVEEQFEELLSGEEDDDDDDDENNDDDNNDYQSDEFDSRQHRKI